VHYSGFHFSVYLTVQFLFRFLSETDRPIYICIFMYVCMYLFIYLLGMLHYFGVILRAVIYMLVSFAGGAVTSIMAPVIAFPLQF